MSPSFTEGRAETVHGGRNEQSEVSPDDGRGFIHLDPTTVGTYCDDHAHHQSSRDDHMVGGEVSDGFVPIAVVGMGMRLPGDVRTTETFWSHLLEKRDGLCPVPPNRYNRNAFDSQSKPLPKYGHFLQEDLACFDASFFSITAHEAARLDPQQRLLLEVIWECLENGGVIDWEGKDIGCFIGTFGDDWLNLQHQDRHNVDRYHAMSTGAFALANHVSYKYDFRGPSMTIQTGCSSSLVAVHEACQALGAGSCSAAVVAGTNLIFAPTMTRTMTANMVLSPSGICHTFDERADGYGRGEGVNALYLKRLDAAIQAGDPIRAIIRATATNSDGNCGSIASPSPEAQEKLIRHAYRTAGIQCPAETGLFECHGTGTIAGDTAETSAIAAVLEGKGAILGAVKPNFGHSEGASGITSMIKAVLSLENMVIPPNAHFNTPNPRIPFLREKLSVAIKPVAWPKDRRARASVNGFGIGGSNAHVIIEAPLEHRLGGTRGQASDLVLHTPRLIVVSANDKLALQQRIKQVVQHTETSPNQIQDLVFTLSNRRKHLPHRAFALAQPGKPLEILDFRNGQARPGLDINFIFTGQGAHWVGMGQKLVERYPSVRSRLTQLQSALMASVEPPSWTLEDQICNTDNGNLGNPEICQTVCTAVQIVIVDLLSVWGIRPTAVIGHSSGEIAAAYAASAITASSAILIAYNRGKLANTVSGAGEMAIVGLSSEVVTPYLEDGITIACENSPRSVTVSGTLPGIDQLVGRVRAELPDVFCRKLRLKVAYHSAQMQAIGEEYERSMANCIHINGQSMVPMISSVTAKPVTEPAELDAGYWRRNLESPVRFSMAVEELIRNGDQDRLFIEIGPHAALSGPLKQIFQAASFKHVPTYVPTLIRNDPDCESQLLTVAGHVHIRGATVDLLHINGPGAVVTNLEPYPWQHKERYWHESRLAREWRFSEFPAHELLGSRCGESTDDEPSWRNILQLEDVPWLSGHILQGQVVFPAAGYITMAGEAIRQLTHSDAGEGYSLQNVLFKFPMALEEFRAMEVITSLTPVMLNNITPSGWYALTISSHDGTGWTINCTGQVRRGRDEVHDLNSDPQLLVASQYSRPVSSERWYHTFADLGLPYGPAFRGLQNIRADPRGGKAVATVTDRVDSHGSQYALHPTVIDQCLQLQAIAAAAGIPRRMAGGGAIPASFEAIFVGHGGREAMVSADITSTSSSALCGEAVALHDSQVVLSLQKGLFFRHHDSGSPSCAVPLTAYFGWKPDINFQDPQTLLPRAPPPPDVDWRYGAARGLGTVGLLCILETSCKLENIQPHLPHFAKWKDWIVAEVSNIKQGGYGYLFADSLDWAHWPSSRRLDLIRVIKESAKSRDDDAMAAVECLEIIHENCVDIVQGEKSVLELLLENDRLGSFYSLSIIPVEWNYFLSLLCHSNPVLRVLEIGAGTGSATAKVLQSLEAAGSPAYARYTYTDISTGFLGAAKGRFAQHRNMEFRTLNIAEDPLLQGFNLHEYDLVIASNVLHATPDINHALLNVHKLLAPGGWLLLHELNLETRFVDYVMGTLPGWWDGESDGRVERPYITPAEWDQRLRATGFTGTEAWLNDIEPPFQVTCSMISRVPQPPPARLAISLLIRSAPSAWAEGVQTTLSDLGHGVRFTTLEQDPSKDEWIISLVDVEGPFLGTMTSNEYPALQRHLSKADQSKIMWVTRSTQLACKDPAYGLALGFARCLRHELSQPFCILELDELNDQSANSLGYVLGKLQQSDLPDLNSEYEHTFADGNMYIGRCYWERPAETNGAPTTRKSRGKKLEIAVPGLLDLMKWTELEDSCLAKNEVEVELEYVGLNFKDVMVAMGLVGSTDQLGLEGTGTVRQVGDEVDGFAVGDNVIVVKPGLLRTRVVTDQRYCRKLPNDMSLEEGATVSSVFATAIYSLVNVGHLSSGQSVLIHSACGGVGQAAIQICQLIGAEVFVTVGSQEKIDFLVGEFGIPRTNIFDSRSTSFRSSLMKATNGRGVDIVLNSLAGKMLHASWECVAKFGKMIELGKRDFLTNGTLDLKHFEANRSFIGVDLAQIAELGPAIFEDLLRKFESWFSEGKLRPIHPRTSFDASQVVDAFRLLQKGTHIGKVLIRIPTDLSVLSGHDTERPLRFAANASYLLVGGLGGIGRAVSVWMVENGARHLVYLSRTAGLSPEDHAFMEELQVLGCSVRCVPGSVTDMKAVQEAVSGCEMPLKGVLQMALCLQDAPFGEMSYQQWMDSVNPKVQGTWNLHHATSTASLDFFVAFGSLAGVCGRHGQSNYGAANSFLDAFTQYRRDLGLPSAVISLGAVGDVGFVSRETKILQSLRSVGFIILGEADVVEGLRLAISQCRHTSESDIETGCMKIGASLLVGYGFTRPLADSTAAQWQSDDSRFAFYNHVDAGQHALFAETGSSAIKELFARIERDPDLLLREETETNLAEEFCRLITTFSADAENMDLQERLSIPVDSLMGIELKNWARRNLGIEIGLPDIAKAKTIGGLSKLAIERLKMKYLAPANTDDDPK